MVVIFRGFQLINLSNGTAVNVLVVYHQEQLQRTGTAKKSPSEESES
jgi:hypothetical protein